MYFIVHLNAENIHLSATSNTFELSLYEKVKTDIEI